MREKISYFTKFEWLLLTMSCTIIIVMFCIFDGSNYLSLVNSLVGVTSLTFIAKGNPVGQVLVIIFSVLYGIISLSFAYYGEMITYLGMTAPIAVLSIISWLKNPYAGNKQEVEIRQIIKKDVALMIVSAIIVTVAFYFLLSALNTANLLPSTASITTSYMAGYLAFKRSPYYAVAYAANDLVLIVLWSMATAVDISYISTLACFMVFFANDIYGFVNWRRIQKRQAAGKTTLEH